MHEHVPALQIALIPQGDDAHGSTGAGVSGSVKHLVSMKKGFMFLWR